MTFPQHTTEYELKKTLHKCQKSIHYFLCSYGHVAIQIKYSRNLFGGNLYVEMCLHCLLGKIFLRLSNRVSPSLSK